MKESIDIHLDKTISNSARSVLPISKAWPNRFLSDQISSSGIDARFSPELIPIGLGEFQIHVRLTFRTTPTIFLLHAHLPVINGKTRDGIKREREKKKRKKGSSFVEEIYAEGTLLEPSLSGDHTAYRRTRLLAEILITVVPLSFTLFLLDRLLFR